MNRWIGRETLSKYVLPGGTLIGLILLWEATVRVFNIPSFIIPAPSGIATVTWGQLNGLGGHTLVTLYETLGGFGLSVAFGVGIAVVLSLSKLVRRAVYPLLVVTQSIPKVVLAPIILLIIGYGTFSKMFIAFTIAFFPIIVSTMSGLASTPEEMHELSRSYRSSRWKVLTKVSIPTALPHIFSGLKVGLTLSLVGAVVGEFVGSSEGLGYVVVAASSVFNAELAFGAIVILSAMSVILYALLEQVERWLCPWYATG